MKYKEIYNKLVAKTIVKLKEEYVVNIRRREEILDELDKLQEVRDEN